MAGRRKAQLPPRHVRSATIAPMATERVFFLIHLTLEHSSMTIEEVNTLRSAPPVPDGISDSERAQLLAYDAYDGRFKSWKAVERAVSKALDLDEGCIDAYVAEWLTLEPDGDDAVDTAQVAESLATDEMERRWSEGPDEDLWEDFLNRPIVRGIAVASLSLWAIGEAGDAIMHAERILVLNPGDNLGMRWHLALWHTIVGDVDLARKLLKRYPRDDVAPATYARALTEFAAKGPSRRARQYLAEAQESNPMLFQILQSPAESVVFTADWDCYAHGSWEEALQWHASVRAAWEAVPGALDWVDGVREDDDFARRRERGLIHLLADLALESNMPAGELARHLMDEGVFPTDGE